MLTVGTDSYITLKEADEILTSCHNDSLLDKWLTISESEKECIIRNATYKIDCLPFSGHKHTVNQALQFPRGTSKDIPYKVKLAVAEECLATIDTELLKRISLQQQGVSSITLGSASESYGDSSVYGVSPLLSHTAYNYMRQYICGSVVIR